jgi:hypothetical protein
MIQKKIDLPLLNIFILQIKDLNSKYTLFLLGICGHRYRRKYGYIIPVIDQIKIVTVTSCKFLFFSLILCRYMQAKKPKSESFETRFAATFVVVIQFIVLFFVYIHCIL